MEGVIFVHLQMDDPSPKQENSHSLKEPVQKDCLIKKHQKVTKVVSVAMLKRYESSYHLSHHIYWPAALPGRSCHTL